MKIKDESRANMPRRFYKKVSVVPHAEGFAPALDGRVAKTAAKAPVVAPTEALAALLAAEFEAQTDVVDFNRMPVMRMASTAIDRVSLARAEVAREVASYGGSDLLCYRAEAPMELELREAAAWGPWLDWAKAELNVELLAVTGVIHRPQAPEALWQLHQLAEAEHDFMLTGLSFGAALFGSAILSFAVRQGALDAVEAFEISRIDETFQEERWGVDEEAHARRLALTAEAAMLGKWFDAMRTTD
jgi:chaperone required for assembly of F1-ATPase